MARALYVMSLEPESGKSIASLGLMEMLSRHVDKVGYFRPVIRESDARDVTIELMRSRYDLAQSYDESFGVTTGQTRHLGGSRDAQSIIDEILTRFEALSRDCSMVLVEGTDHTGASAAFEFELNMELATNLGAPVIVVSRAHDHRPDQVSGALHAARGALADRDLAVVGFLVNRIQPSKIEKLKAHVTDLGVPTWFLPEDPQMLLPTIRQAADHLGAQILLGDERSLNRDLASVRIAAMTVPNLMGRWEPDTLVITPGDRSDVILAGMTARFSDSVPNLTGIIATGGIDPDPSILAFIRGLSGTQTPLLTTHRDTFESAALLAELRPEIRASDDRKIAAALGLFETHVDTVELAERIDIAESTVVTPLMFQNRMLRQARTDKKRIVLPEGNDDRVLTAADRLLQRDVCELTILGDVEKIRDRAKSLGLNIGDALLIDPETSIYRDEFAAQMYELRKHKGLTLEVAQDMIVDVSVFGTMLVQRGVVDGMVSGACHTTAETIRPALRIVKTVPGVSVVSSVFFMCLADRVLVYGDCAVNPTPTPEQLADIAVSSAVTARAFGIEPRVAMLSYSTGGSGGGGDVESVREATAIAHERAPELLIDGPIQYDAAVDVAVAAAKLPDSQVAGRATVFIFPDLNTGNNTYKAVQRSARAVAIGPILQGLRKPINDLSRGATVEDIISTVVITAVQCQSIGH
ncbi:MAG: phosphate acetyltransferase [Candidatus Nanopelagicales bacterium]